MGMDSNQINEAKLRAMQDIAKSQTEIVRLMTIIAGNMPQTEPVAVGARARKPHAE